MARGVAIQRRLWQRRSTWIVAGLAAVLLASAFWRGFGPAQLQTPNLFGLQSSPSGGVVPTTVENPGTAPRVLNPAPISAPASPDGAPRLGVFAAQVGATPQDGTAALGRTAASARTYVVGAILENGAEITAIHPDRVELTHQMQRYTLYAPGAEPGALALAQATEAQKALGAETARTIHTVAPR